ncbi:MAG: diheme cytochrome c [Rhodocyclaceae bacterium]|jgi:mono/diheme cytochrome c family protein|nr:diheme cytochrome c [Rhodocyclaceae bacterium]
MNPSILRPLALGAAVLAVTALLFGRARAGDDDYYPPVTDQLTLQECASCHIAFPPSMLPAASWKRMMGELDNHFGDDASIDAESNAAITRYLTEHAGDAPGQASKLLRGVRAGDAPQRITELPKWVREHDEVPKSDWARKDVGSKANCTACHIDAERGYFEDD